MGLVHKHASDANVKMPKITRPFAYVTAGAVCISKGGKTPMWSGDFGGCIGVVMCGKGSWGAFAHLHQNIQDKDQSLERALSTVSEFVGKQTNDKVREVLLFYGDPGSNMGEDQGAKLTEVKVKEVMKCDKVIDLRRKDKSKALFAPYGTDFVYDPSLQVVYTTPNGTAPLATGLNDNDKEVTPQASSRSKYPYADGTEKLVKKGLGYKGWFFVP